MQCTSGRRRLFGDEQEALEFVRSCGLQWVGSRVCYFDRTDSTNVRARGLGRPEGTLVVAEHQAHGRGRLGRRWVCPARAGLLVSVLVGRPRLGTLAPQWLTAAGALAMAEAGGPVADPRGQSPCAASRGKLLIEWPNDLVVRRGRKLGGVLVEGENDSRVLVLGVGLNVDARPEEFPPEIAPAAGSLLTDLGVSPDRRDILGRFLCGLERRLAEPGRLPAEYEERSCTLGREVTVHIDGRRARGRAIGFDEEMRLVVELPGGRVEAVASPGLLGPAP